MSFMNNDDILVREQEVSISKVEIDTRRLDSWLIENLRVMEELTLLEPSCWVEVDTGG